MWERVNLIWARLYLCYTFFYNMGTLFIYEINEKVSEILNHHWEGGVQDISITGRPQ